MKRSICAIILCVFLCLLSVAFAANTGHRPVEPDFGKHQHLSPQLATEPNMLDTGMRIEVSGNEEMDYGENTIRITVSGGTAPYTVESMLCNIEVKGFTSCYKGIEVHTTNDVQSTCTETYEIIVPRVYGFYIRVTDAEGRSTELYSKEFEIEADNTHPTLTDMAREFLEDMPSGLSDIEKAIWIYDAVIGNCEYDDTYKYHGPEHFFTKQIGVCDTYSYVIQLLFEEAGIPCGRVVNYEHAWNIACIDNEWFMLDATWGDGDAADRLIYFGMTEELARIDHDYFYNGYDGLIEGFEYETIFADCDTVKYNLMVVEGLAETWINFPCEYPQSSTTELSLLQQTGHPVITLPCGVPLKNGLTLYLYGNDVPTEEDILIETVRTACIYQINTHGYTATRSEKDPISISVDIPDEILMPASATAVANEAFADNTMRSVRVNADCASVGSKAFAGNAELRRVYVNGMNTSFANDAFSGSKYVVLYVKSGSAAQRYAVSNGIDYEIIK